MAQKIPPPPPLTKDFQQLNRWLLELQSIFNSQGTINPGEVDGLPALTAAVAGLSVTVAGLSITVAANSAAIAANAAAIAALNTSITIINTAIIALQARNQIRNGTGVPSAGLGGNGDLYINNTGGAGTRLYGKIGGAWVSIA